MTEDEPQTGAAEEHPAQRPDTCPEDAADGDANGAEFEHLDALVHEPRRTSWWGLWTVGWDENYPSMPAWIFHRRSRRYRFVGPIWTGPT